MRRTVQCYDGDGTRHGATHQPFTFTTAISKKKVGAKLYNEHEHDNFQVAIEDLHCLVADGNLTGMEEANQISLIRSEAGKYMRGTRLYGEKIEKARHFAIDTNDGHLVYLIVNHP